MGDSMKQESKDRVYHIFSERIVPIFSLIVTILAVMNLWSFFGFAEKNVVKDLKSEFPQESWILKHETHGPTIIYLAVEREHENYEVGVFEKTSWPYLVYKETWTSGEEPLVVDDIAMFHLKRADGYASFNSPEISRIDVRDGNHETYEVNENYPFVFLTDKGNGVTFYDSQGRIYSAVLN